jgi:heme-degrading monooxygenase HmoA
MGTPTTELAYITVKEGLERDVLDKSTPAGQAFTYMVDMVIKAPGAREAHWGPSIENPRQIWILVAWDDLQDHLNYRETE